MNPEQTAVMISTKAAELNISFHLLQFALHSISEAVDKNKSQDIDDRILTRLAQYYYIKKSQRLDEQATETPEGKRLAIRSQEEPPQEFIKRLGPLYARVSQAMSEGPFTYLKLDSISCALGEITTLRQRHDGAYACEIVEFNCASEVEKYRYAKNNHSKN